MNGKKLSIPRGNCLKYTLKKREVRYWFIRPQDSDHWACHDRRRNIIERIAICAMQNGFAGVQVFHPNGVHLETVTCVSDNCMGFCTEKGGADLEKELGDVSFAGQSNKAFVERFRSQKNLKWRRHNLLPLAPPE